MNALQRTVQQIASHPRGAAFFRITRIDAQDRLAHRLSGRRATVTGLFAAFPTVMVTTTGRRSGRPHTVPLIAVSDPDRPGVIALIASNFGQGHDPDWCRNLRADPEAVVLGDEGTRRRRAREVHGAEMERWFALGTEIYTGYPGYRRRAGRPIPVFELEPVAG
jgi:deazaflavin-dependent oxidoreductase (nitroreductase family)